MGGKVHADARRQKYYGRSRKRDYLPYHGLPPVDSRGNDFVGPSFLVTKEETKSQKGINCHHRLHYRK